MARRKKETPDFHRESIAIAAEHLFTTKGIYSTTMDDIAKKAGYSKATLYVYFKNKEEIIAVLVLKSMRMLLERIRFAVNISTDTHKQYIAMCNELVDYQEEFPFYFDISLGKINIDFERPDALAVEKEIFETGELINSESARFIQTGIENGSLRKDIDIPKTVFIFWASLSGTIVMASKKAEYITKIFDTTKQEFLNYGFKTLYYSIAI